MSPTTRHEGLCLRLWLWSPSSPPVPSAALADWVERTCENLPGVPTPPPVTSPPNSSETASPCTHTGGTGSGRSPDALRELNVFLCNF